MANIITVQTVLDGPRNTVLKVAGVLDTVGAINQFIIRPTDLCPINNNGVKAKRLLITNCNYTISDLATAQVLFQSGTSGSGLSLSGWGEIDAKKFGGIADNTGGDGSLVLLMPGFVSGTPQTFTIVLQLVKQER
jgi:hypothetical protein